MKILGLLIVLAPCFAFGQKSEMNQMTDLINRIYKADSSHFVFDLGLIPTEITKRIMKTNDSLSYLSYKERETLKLKRFMANTYEKWNATDMVTDENLPFRRFIYAIKSGTKWILTYEHGGIGAHYHVVYLDTKDYKSLTTSVTLLNSKEIDDLIWNKKIEEIEKRQFGTIVRENEFHMFRGQLVKNYDVF
jgi:hypothetical protein